MLYCALTGQLMDKSLEAVKQHMQGKRFQMKKGGGDEGIPLRPPSASSDAALGFSGRCCP